MHLHLPEGGATRCTRRSRRPLSVERTSPRLRISRSIEPFPPPLPSFSLSFAPLDFGHTCERAYDARTRTMYDSFHGSLANRSRTLHRVRSFIWSRLAERAGRERERERLQKNATRELFELLLRQLSNGVGSTSRRLSPIYTHPTSRLESRPSNLTVAGLGWVNAYSTATRSPGTRARVCT